ncbi:MAG: hypothetical protein LUE29_01300 [Lachnospiraceae bacterium]|nr:hypothetical protein [Lachnospiraceae bacterium]
MGESEVELNVCQAIQTLNQRAEEKGRETGRIENLVQNIRNLMKNMGLTAEQAMGVLDVSDSDRDMIAPRF